MGKEWHPWMGKPVLKHPGSAPRFQGRSGGPSSRGWQTNPNFLCLKRRRQELSGSPRPSSCACQPAGAREDRCAHECPQAGPRCPAPRRGAGRDLLPSPDGPLCRAPWAGPRAQMPTYPTCCCSCCCRHDGAAAAGTEAVFSRAVNQAERACSHPRAPPRRAQSGFQGGAWRVPARAACAASTPRAGRAFASGVRGRRGPAGDTPALPGCREHRLPSPSRGAGWGSGSH